MKPLGKFAQAFVRDRKRKRGGPAAEPSPKAAHNAPPDAMCDHKLTNEITRFEKPEPTEMP